MAGLYGRKFVPNSYERLSYNMKPVGNVGEQIFDDKNFVLSVDAPLLFALAKVEQISCHLARFVKSPIQLEILDSP